MKPVLTLGFDTSGPHCAGALVRDGTIIAERLEEMTRGQAERLMPMLEELLEEAGLGWQDLSAIGVGVGPGNFTGIRIAVSAARGLALGLGIPAVGVTGFEMRAAEGVLPAVPAPRDQVYVLQKNSDAELMPATDAEQTATDLGLTLDAEASPSNAGAVIVRLAAERFGSATEPPSPLYARSADAAPSRDTPPLILDS